MDTAQDDALAIVRVRSWLRTGRARAIRERAGMSQADVGLAVGSDHAQVSRWETGMYSPARRSALRLARLYEGMEEIIRDENAGKKQLMRSQDGKAQQPRIHCGTESSGCHMDDS